MDAARTFTRHAVERAMLISFPTELPSLFPPFPLSADAIQQEFDMRDVFVSDKRQCMACELDSDDEDYFCLRADILGRTNSCIVLKTTHVRCIEVCFSVLMEYLDAAARS